MVLPGMCILGRSKTGQHVLLLNSVVCDTNRSLGRLTPALSLALL